MFDGAFWEHRTGTQVLTTHGKIGSWQVYRENHSEKISPYLAANLSSLPYHTNQTSISTDLKHLEYVLKDDVFTNYFWVHAGRGIPSPLHWFYPHTLYYTYIVIPGIYCVSSFICLLCEAASWSERKSFFVSEIKHHGFVSCIAAVGFNGMCLSPGGESWTYWWVNWNKDFFPSKCFKI